MTKGNLQVSTRKSWATWPEPNLQGEGGADIERPGPKSIYNGRHFHILSGLVGAKFCKGHNSQIWSGLAGAKFAPGKGPQDLHASPVSMFPIVPML